MITGASDEPLLRTDRVGIACRAGGFHIDPWGPAACAVITHAHADHAKRGSQRYIAHAHSLPVLRDRLGKDTPLQGLEYHEPIDLGNVRVSLHPAGHVLGSAQIRVESEDAVWVISGDYKRHPDPTCAPFEPVRCDVFVTESTFGLPIYRWPDPHRVADDINAWWRSERARGRTCVLYAYALGKAQRLLALLDPSIGPIALHPAIDDVTKRYREQGIELPDTVRFLPSRSRELRGSAIVLIPPSAEGGKAFKALAPTSDASASGWMRTRGARRWRSYDRGFVLSDHADWPGLLRTIEETGARRVGVTHGSVEPLVRYLREAGTDAFPLETEYTGDDTHETDG